jgi:catechol 2,3-dioxygenase-like lactoylglutathione lyase family enzyme
MLSKAPVTATIPFRGLKKADTFYGRKLGLRRVDGSPREGWLLFRAGKKSDLLLFESTSRKKSDNTSATFEVAHLAREMATLRKRGVKFQDYDLPGIRTVDGVMAAEGMGKIAWVKDPDGNILALHESE